MEAVQYAGPAGARVTLEDKSWPVTIEAQGGDHLRVRLHRDGSTPFPDVPEGTRLDLTMASKDGGYYAETTVLKQTGNLLWLRIPAIWDSLERRGSRRGPGGFGVIYQVDGVSHRGKCINIGVGGMMMRASRPWPAMTRLNVQFRLPGEETPMHLQGLVIRSTRILDLLDAVDVGIKFVSVEAEDIARIAKYVAA